MSVKTVLTNCLEEMDLTLDDEQISLLLRYISEIELFNPKYKLVGASGEDLVLKHIADCLSAVKVIQSLIKDNPNATFCDVGSGAGLPGLVLAIAFKDHKFTLVERMTRRVNFLNNAIAALKLNDRVEIIAKDLKNVEKQFDIVTFRAFHPLFDILDDIDKIVTKESFVCAYKAKMDTVEEELAKVEESCSSKWNARFFDLFVPKMEAERRLCVLNRR